MGWYRVTKTVKGRKYAYMQRSWREGKRVLTQSISLGPVTEGGSAATHGTPADVAAIITTKNRTPTAPASPALRLRFNPERAKISVARLESDIGKMRQWASRLGVPADKFPGIVMASGASLAHRKAHFSNNMVVLIPRNERNRSAIRREVHKATARALLDGLRHANPERFAAVAGAMDKSYRETNRLLYGFLSKQDGASKVALSLQIYGFGYTSTPRGGLNDKPERLGVAGYGDDARRRSWEDEAVSLLAEAQSKGWAKIAETQGKASKDANRAEKAAMRRYLETKSLFDRFTGKRRLMRKKLAQAVQARQLCEEAERKTALLRSSLAVDG